MGHFKKDDNYIYLEDNSCEFYIPQYYFEDNYKFASDEGNMIKCIGIFNVAFFDANGNVIERKMLNLPTWISLFVYESEDRSIKLPSDLMEENYKVITYYKNMKIMPSKIVKDADNVEGYLDFIMKGKMPHSIKYSDSIDIWIKNQKMNGTRLGVPSTELEMILAVYYRYKNDPTKKFATVIGADKSVSEYDYVMKNTRQICQYTSTYAGITFEDIDSMITTSLNRTKRKETELNTPTESILKL